jgi:hypothetical protein
MPHDAGLVHAMEEVDMRRIKILAACSMIAIAGAIGTAGSAAAQEGRAAYVDEDGVCRICVPGYNCPCAVLPPVIIK